MDDSMLETLIARTAGGDAQALHRLYEQLGSAVFALARAILRDRALAEDVLQDTFVRVWAKAHAYRPGTSPKAWILGIARNAAYSTLRSRRLETPAEQAADRPGGETDAADAAALQAAMDALQPEARQIVLLNALGGFTHREIASILGIPAGSISWKYRKAMDSLKRQLSDHEQEVPHA